LKSAGFWVGFLILVFACVLFGNSLSYEYYSKYGPGPGMFPLWLSGSLIVLSLIHIGQSMKKTLDFVPMLFPKGKELTNVLEIIGSIILFIIIAPFAGYIVANIVLLIILFMRKYKWYWGVAISIGVTLVLFVVFQFILQVPLPVGIFGW
jgi:putative tricarboxylic transport membrane protein